MSPPRHRGFLAFSRHFRYRLGMAENELRDIIFTIVQELSSVERFMRGDDHNRPLPSLAINCLDVAERLLSDVRLMIVESENS